MNKLSFCINTARNELNHIKLLFRSLEENLSSKEHEILVFIDSDNQGTFDWLLTKKDVFPNLRVLKNHLPICYGYARNINEMFKQASNEIVSYLQSDMVICKNYDQELLQRIEPNTILCSTRIEPPLHGNSGEKITHDFGLDPTQFDLKAFTEFAELQKKEELTEYFFAPFTLYKDVWNSIGGHDTQFRRSREDSDVLARLVLNNVAIVQTWSAIVYHFTCTSSRGPNWFDSSNREAQERAQLQQTADNIEMGRFFKKWGSFYHDTQKVKHFNIVANVLGGTLELQKFVNFETFFDTVYVEDETIIEVVQEYYDRLHIAANKLLGISDETWKEYGYLYNTQKASDRIKPLSESAGDVVVEFNLNQVDYTYVPTFIIKLQDIIGEMDDVGTFEYGPFAITVNRIQDKANELVKVANPEIKPEHLYTIN
jgi:glycosyltransferase involved in cell wall biosynthesis